MKARATIAMIVLALGLAACGDSPEDQARSDGKDVGKAAHQLYNAATPEDAQKAVGDLKSAVDSLHSDTRKRVSEQIDTQRSAVSTAADAFAAGQSGATDPEVARSQLQQAVQQIRSQADSFRNTNNSVANEFWRGFEEGYDDD